MQDKPEMHAPLSREPAERQTPDATLVDAVNPASQEIETQAESLHKTMKVYSIGFAVTNSSVSIHFHERAVITFNVRDPIDGVATRAGYTAPMPGAVRPLLPWTLKPLHQVRTQSSNLAGYD